MQIQIPNCPNCGASLIKKMKDEEVFYACPNWRKGCKGYTWTPVKSKLMPPKNDDKIMDALRVIWKEVVTGRDATDRLAFLEQRLIKLLERFDSDGKVVFYPKDEKPE